MRWREGLVLVVLVACTGSPPEPPPSYAIPPPPPQVAVAATTAVPRATAAAISSATGAAKPSPPPVRVSIVIEQPYKLGERPKATSRKQYIDGIRERRHWNSGGMGKLTAPAAPVIGHPDPRVIINLDKIRGPHRGKDVLRLARRNHWMKVIRCYRLGAYKDRHLRGWTKAVFDVSPGGRASNARLLDTKLADKQVANCMVTKLETLKLGRAARSSRVWLSLRVAPGDEPMPPPPELIVPGDGELSQDDMKLGVQRTIAGLERCYRAAFGYAPGLWGRMLIRFHVTERGRLDEAFEAGSRFPDKRVRQCVLRAARSMRFARPKKGDLRFVVPIRFFSNRSQHRQRHKKAVRKL